MAKKWVAAPSRSMKLGLRETVLHAVTASDGPVAEAAAVAILAVAVAVTASPMRTTASRPASPANRAGKPRLSMNVEWNRTSEETHEYHLPKASEGTQASGKATGEGREA